MSRGQIWMVDFDPIRGREQAGRRPAIVFSADYYNRVGSGLAAVIPLTSRDHGLPWHERIPPEASGLPRTSWALLDPLRFISMERLVESQPRGSLPPGMLRSIERRVSDISGL